VGAQVLAFLFDPRQRVRGLVGTKPWRVVVAFSLADGLLFALAAAEMPAENVSRTV